MIRLINVDSLGGKIGRENRKGKGNCVYIFFGERVCVSERWMSNCKAELGGVGGGGERS